MGGISHTFPAACCLAQQLARTSTFMITNRRMDRASVVLSQGLDPSKPQTYAALSEEGDCPRTTLWYRAHGRPSKEEKAKRQQYLTPSEEKALVGYLLRMSRNGFPVPVKHLRPLAFTIVRQRSSVFQVPSADDDEAMKPPGKN